MFTMTDIDAASTICHRWTHIFDLEEQARRGNEDALRLRELTGLRGWLL